MQTTLYASAKTTPYQADTSQTRHLLQKCSNMAETKQIHARMFKTGTIQDPLLVGKLLSTAASPNTGDLNYARQLFDETKHPNTFMWNALFRAYKSEQALLLYVQMVSSSVLHNSYTFPFLLKACSNMDSTKQIHGRIVKFGFGSDVFAINSLIRAYAVSGSVNFARQVFDMGSERDTVSWNSMIHAYVKCGKVRIGYQLFRDMPEKNVVSWTTMMSGFVDSGLNMEALEIFREMQISEVRPDRTALGSVVSACAQLGAIDQGRFLHAYIEKNKIGIDKVLCCALIDMYAKCGFMEEAVRVFRKSNWRCVSIWTAVISGFAVHGRVNEALEWFENMTNEGVEPNPVTWTAVLSACSYTGLVHEGRSLFQSMKSVPSIEHYGCMVHLLSRSGLIDEAKTLIDAMPMKPNATILGALLSACQIHGRTELGKQIAEALISIDSRHGGRYIQVAGIFAEAGDWEGSVRARESMKDSGVKKLRGCSSITVNGTVHEFYASNASHPQIEEITRSLDRVFERLRLEEGYRPAVGKLVVDFEDEEKEAAISQHSEKLAMAFGLIATKQQETIRIFKNLRVCEDCHTVAKMVSKIYGRRIVMRDKSRFHIFKDGICSCDNYW